MTQPGQETDLFHPLAAVESKIDRANALLQQLLNAKGVITPANSNPNAQVGNSFVSVTIDLTAARTAVQIPLPSYNFVWLQAWSDGPLDGISLSLNNPSSTGYVLSRINTIPVTGLTQSIYLTNDVRPGRSQLVLYLVNSANPLSLIYAGVDISQTEVAARLGSIDTSPGPARFCGWTILKTA